MVLVFLLPNQELPELPLFDFRRDPNQPPLLLLDPLLPCYYKKKLVKWLFLKLQFVIWREKSCAHWKSLYAPFFRFLVFSRQITRGWFIYFSQKFSALWGTEISVVRPQYRNFCGPYYRKISVKNRWINLKCRSR